MGVWSQVAGAATNPSVVLVHGSMDRSAGLLRLSRQLDRDHCVLRYDRRGYARSAGLGPPWTVAANLDDLEGAIAEQDPDGESGGSVVFGHSFGGNVALGLAARCPQLVRAVVVYEPPLSWLDWWPGNSAGAAAMAASDPDDAAEAFMRRLIGDDAWERLPDSKQRERRAEGATMVAELADLRRHVPWQPDDITVPVLALHGERARPHHRRATTTLSTTIDDCHTGVIEAAGHAGPHTNPAEVARVVRSFVAALVAPAPSTATPPPASPVLGDDG